MLKTKLPLLVTIVVAFVPTPRALPQCKLMELLPPMPDEEWFGYDVAITHTRVLVGASREGPPFHQAGAAYLFRRDGTSWVLEATLQPQQPETGDFFGESVALSSDDTWAFVTAPGDNLGATYVFRREGTVWVAHSKLTASDSQLDLYYGSAVATEDDLLLVGAQNGDLPGISSVGRVYVYRLLADRWTEEAALTPSDPVRAMLFGASVSIDAGTAVVGAKGGSAAYIFEHNGAKWVERQKLVPFGNGQQEWFGGSVDKRDALVVVGAPGGPFVTSMPGAAYLYYFDGSTWIGGQTLVGASADDQFGCSVSVNGNTLMIGASLDDEQCFGAGAAYEFHFDGAQWIEAAKLLASDGGVEDQFGSALDVRSGRTIVGAWNHGNQGFNDGFGAAYLFGVGPGDCNGNGVPDACDVGLGVSLDCDGNGVLDECDVFDGTLHDDNGSGVADECEAAGDLDGSGTVSTIDLLTLLADWGPCADPCPPTCPADATGDCVVSTRDLLNLLTNWGATY